MYSLTTTLVKGSYVHFFSFSDGTSETHSAVLDGPLVGEASFVVSTIVDEKDGTFGPGDLSLRKAPALAAVASGDDIIAFDPALTGQTLSLNVDLGPLVVNSNVTIVGPGADRLTLDGANETLLFRIESGVTAHIRGVTMLNGGWSEACDARSGSIYNYGHLFVTDTVISNGEGLFGGALHNEGAAILLDCTIVGNTSSFGGGGAVFNTATLDMIRCTVADNTGFLGGAIANLDTGEVTITDSKLFGNSALQGGAIQNQGWLQINSSSLEGNAARDPEGITGSGGAISNHGTLIVGDCEIRRNIGSSGAGIHNSGTMTLERSVIAQNSASGSGGGMRLSGPSTITDCLISDNSATSHGGGLDCFGTVTVTASALTNNSAEYGAGIMSWGTLVLEESLVSNNAATESGGGICGGEDSTLMLADSAISGNSAEYGAGIMSWGTLVLDACLVSNNTAAENGGGISSGANSVLTVSKSDLRDNSARWAAGVFNHGVGTLTAATLTGNVAADSGGGVSNWGSLTLASSTVSGNSSGAFGGGGISSDLPGSTMTIADCDIQGNYSTGQGAAISNNGAGKVTSSTIAGNESPSGEAIHNTRSLTLEGCTLSGNLGGGAHNTAGSTLVLLNCTITANASGAGSGILNSGILNLLNCTITHNHINNQYASAALDNRSPGVSTLHNTIIAGNTSAAGGSTDVRGTFDASSSHNVIGVADGSSNLASGLGTQHGTLAEPLDARLAPLTNNGGRTLTHALLADSPAIDAGDNDQTTAAGLIVDQAGRPRIVDGNANNMAAVDIGAYEAGTAISVTINQSDSQSDPTTVQPIIFTAVFGADVTDFTADDVHLAGTAAGTLIVTVTGSGAAYNVAVSGMTSDGTVIATIRAGTVHDAHGKPNAHSTSTDSDVTYDAPDTTPPTVTLNQAVTQSDPTRTSPINFTVVFDEPVAGFSADDVTLSGTAGAATATVTGSGTTYNVAVTGMTSSGTVSARIAAGRAQDAAGNLNLASTSSDNTVVFDTILPTVAITRPANQPDPADVLPINFTVVFSEAVTDFSADDVTISATALDKLTAIVTGSGTTYNVAVTGMTTSATVAVSVPAGAVHDTAGNPNAASSSSDNSVHYKGPRSNYPTLWVDDDYSSITPGWSDDHFAKIQDAWDRAVDGWNDTIIVAPGTYVENLILWQKGLVLQSLNPNDPSVVASTIIDGGGVARAVDINAWESTGFVLSGFTIQNGYAYYGGGISITGPGASTLIEKNVIINNWASEQGGAVYAFQSSPNDHLFTFHANVFKNNHANMQWGRGGAICATRAAHLDLIENRFEENTATWRGGAVFVDDGAQITSSGDNFIRNSAGRGGAIALNGAPGNEPASVNLTCALIHENTAGKYGGAIDASDGSVIKLANCVLAANSARELGGAIHLQGAQGEIRSSTLYGNSASGFDYFGACVDVWFGSTVSIWNSIIAYSPNGSGIFLDDPASHEEPSLLTIVNSNVFGNASGEYEGMIDPTGFRGTISSPPLFVDPHNGDYHLSAGSPCIDAADGATATFNDMDGNSRHDDPGTINMGYGTLDFADLGAFEFQGCTLRPVIDKATEQADPTRTALVRFVVTFGQPVRDFESGDVSLSGTAGATTAIVAPAGADGTTYDVTVSGMSRSGTVVAAIASHVAHDDAGNGNMASISTDNEVVYISPWQNYPTPLDTNNDAYIAAIDALVIINELNRGNSGRLPPPVLDHQPPPYYDVNGDHHVSPVDAIQVINYLNRGEGETVATSDRDMRVEQRPLGVTIATPIESAEIRTSPQTGRRAIIDSRQSASVLQSLDWLFAKLDDAHGMKTWEPALPLRDMFADDLEESLASMLTGDAEGAACVVRSAP